MSGKIDRLQTELTELESEMAQLEGQAAGWRDSLPALQRAKLETDSLWREALDIKEMKAAHARFRQADDDCTAAEESLANITKKLDTLGRRKATLELELAAAQETRRQRRIDELVNALPTEAVNLLHRAFALHLRGDPEPAGGVNNWPIFCQQALKRFCPEPAAIEELYRQAIEDPGVTQPGS